MILQRWLIELRGDHLDSTLLEEDIALALRTGLERVEGLGPVTVTEVELDEEFHVEGYEDA